jgi:hypothetical protein
MTANEFHERMLFLLRRRPFVPFDVELIDGTRLWVDRPDAVATGGGGASFGDPAGEIHLFDWTNTRRLGPDDLRPDDPGPYGPFTIHDPFAIPGGPGPMTRAEFREQLEKLVRQRPFVPFVIEFTDGERLAVTLPDLISLGGTPLYGDERGELMFLDYQAIRAFHLVERAASA